MLAEIVFPSFHVMATFTISIDKRADKNLVRMMCIVVPFQFFKVVKFVLPTIIAFEFRTGAGVGLRSLIFV